MSPSGADDVANSFESVFAVRSFDVGPDKGASLPCIANMLQETGVEQLVSQHGRGGRFYATDPEMDRLNLIFVLSRMRVDMRRYPAWGSRVAVRTWFAESGRAAWRRDWLVRDADTGEHLGAASSTWLTVNTKTRRLAKVTDALRDKYARLTNDDAWALGDGVTAEKVPDASARRDAAAGALPDGEYKVNGEGDDGAYELRVPFGSLDMNGHVNNVQYMMWILDSVPAAVRAAMMCTSITIEYRSESEVGSSVRCMTLEETDDDEREGDSMGTRVFLHSVHTVSEPDGARGAEVARARSRWVDYSSSS